MNVLALYDIHGNPDALEAVLADPRAAGADLALVGGDAVPGPFCAVTLARLAELPTRWVRGNGEREVAAALGAPKPDAGDWAAITSWLTAAELGAQRARPLGELPLTTEIDGILYCHATPRSDEEILTRLSAPERYAAALAEVSAPVVVAGHTHQHHDRTVGATRYINAGSVGLPYEGDGVPELRRTAYDAAAAGRRMLAAGWPDERSVGAALIEPVDPLVITTLFEERAAGAT